MKVRIGTVTVEVDGVLTSGPSDPPHPCGEPNSDSLLWLRIQDWFFPIPFTTWKMPFPHCLTHSDQRGLEMLVFI